MRYITLILLLISRIVNAEYATVTTTFVNSSAYSLENASSKLVFYTDGRLSGWTSGYGANGVVVQWEGAYNIFDDSGNRYVRLFSDASDCTYWIGSIGEYMKYTNVQRNYNNICPDLLMKNITGKEWAY